MITIAIIITTILEYIRIYIQEIPIVARKTTQALKNCNYKNQSYQTYAKYQEILQNNNAKDNYSDQYD